MSETVELTPGQLAQYRGCWPHDETCYPECVEAAEGTIADARKGDPEAVQEVDAAAAWAATQRWN